jgi:hypothetical protein
MAKKKFHCRKIRGETIITLLGVYPLYPQIKTSKTEEGIKP